MIAARFVEDGITDPRVVERFLIVEDYQVSIPRQGEMSDAGVWFTRVRDDRATMILKLMPADSVTS